MRITPKQRRRALRVHYLRQQGQSLKHIAEQLNVAVSTVRADLKLVQAHWSRIAAAAADDLLLESLQLLQIRLAIAVKGEVIGNNAKYLTPVEYIRAEDARNTQLNALAREIRRTVKDVHQRAGQPPDQPELYDEEPQEPQEPQELAETTSKSSQIEPPNSTISSPEQEIVDSEAQKEKLPGEPNQDALIEEAIQHFPHLEGQPEDQILQFLDQITNPEGENQDQSPEIYAEAAG